eukprot:11635-Eustigmatos_ZCMA.PRE.1
MHNPPKHDFTDAEKTAPNGSAAFLRSVITMCVMHPGRNPDGCKGTVPWHFNPDAHLQYRFLMVLKGCLDSIGYFK